MKIMIAGFLCGIFLLPLNGQVLDQKDQKQRKHAYAFLHRMWRGANFMASKMENQHYANEDYVLLAENHFTHCRIGGKLDLHTGSAPDFTVEQEKLQDIKAAVDLALENGIIAVVDPLHQFNKTYTDADLGKLKKIWEQVASFLADYSTDSVAFEIMNEPHDGINMLSVINESLDAVRSVPGNESRIVIASGQGFSTRQALINALNHNYFPAGDSCLIGTYHYYDPRDFTKQGTKGVVQYWGESGDLDPDWDAVRTAFDEVVEANMNWAERNSTVPLPLYLGEFGVDKVSPDADRKRWLSWIRTQAEKRGHATALWNMYSPSGKGKGIGPWEQAQKNDPTTRYLREDLVEALMTRYELESGIIGGTVSTSRSHPEYSGSGYADFSAAGRQDSLILESLYVPRGDIYDLYIRYSKPDTSKTWMTMKIFNSDNQLVATEYLSGWQADLPGSDWSLYHYQAELPAGTDTRMVFLPAGGSQQLKLDYLCITQGEYYDHSHPVGRLTAGISDPVVAAQGLPDLCIKIHPVPFTRSLQIHAGVHDQGALRVSILDMSGRIIQERIVHGGQTIHAGRDWPEGMYLIRIYNETGQVFRKVVKH